MGGLRAVTEVTCSAPASTFKLLRRKNEIAQPTQSQRALDHSMDDIIEDEDDTPWRAPTRRGSMNPAAARRGSTLQFGTDEAFSAVPSMMPSRRQKHIPPESAGEEGGTDGGSVQRRRGSQFAPQLDDADGGSAAALRRRGSGNSRRSSTTRAAAARAAVAAPPSAAAAARAAAAPTTAIARLHPAATAAAAPCVPSIGRVRTIR